jgi:uncharacterized protein
VRCPPYAFGRDGRRAFRAVVSATVASDDEAALEAVVGQWLSIPELADQIGLTASQVRELVRERRLVVVERGTPRVKSVPAEFVHDGALVKGLAGALTVLADAGYNPTQALRWLLTDQDALPGRPIEYLAAGRHTAVKRLAMALAF